MQRKHLRGVSLVSLLIGSGLSAFLLIVLLQIFSSSKSNYKIMKNMNELTDALNFFVANTNDILRYAGYRIPQADGSLPSLNQAFPGFHDLPEAAAGRYIMPYVSANNKDGFIIAYQGDSNGVIKDCLGSAVYNNNANVAYLIFSQNARGSNNSMVCSRYTGNNTKRSTEVISSVLDEFWVRFGVDSNSDGQIDYFVPAAQMQSNDFNKVLAIQISLLLRSREEVYPKNINFSFNQWGQTITKNSRYLHKHTVITVPFLHAT
jgi:Tfp pilus assembly protein PilW